MLRPRAFAPAALAVYNSERGVGRRPVRPRPDPDQLWTGTPLPSSQSAMALFDAFRPKWKHSDPDVRVAAAGELDDPMILRRMVIEDGHSFVRHRVFDILREKYPDQEMYADLAKNSDDEEIRRKAIKKLLDESFWKKSPRTTNTAMSATPPSIAWKSCARTCGASGRSPVELAVLVEGRSAGPATHRVLPVGRS